jgi:hypothetical protein
MKNAKLEFAPSDSAGPARVSLSLPGTLASAIQAEAAKLGLSDEARSISVTVKLAGGGKDINPGGVQSARLTPGQGADFAWQAPTGAGTLTADITGSLDGAGNGKAFPLGALMAQASTVAAPAAAPEAPVSAQSTTPSAPARQVAIGLPFSLGFLALPGHPMINLPVFGETPSENVVATAIVLVVLLVLAALARDAAARRERAERRRVAHVFDGPGSGEEAAAGAAGHDGHGGQAMAAAAAYGVQGDQGGRDAFTLQPSGEAEGVNEDQGAHAHPTPLASTVYYDLGHTADAAAATEETHSGAGHSHDDHAHAEHDEEAHAPA